MPDTHTIAAAEVRKAVLIDYTNHRGERSSRVILPRGMWFGPDAWHLEPQWLLDAFDVQKGALRTFAMRDIHSWATWAEVAKT